MDALARISSTSFSTWGIDHKLLCPVMSLLQDCSGKISVDFFLSFGSYEQLPPTILLNEHLTIDIFVYKLFETETFQH